uniref:(California timema) hypothetical protein n=1 Tax=Timema californicum TaxID=61474 RepID=A0A7R9P7J0_TIMCA|nr:unnamed protein product [Timema californicum]
MVEFKKKISSFSNPTHAKMGLRKVNGSKIKSKVALLGRRLHGQGPDWPTDLAGERRDGPGGPGGLEDLRKVLGRLNTEDVNPHLRGRRVENHLQFTQARFELQAPCTCQSSSTPNYRQRTVYLKGNVGVDLSGVGYTVFCSSASQAGRRDGNNISLPRNEGTRFTI